jgi:hypothetical protein
MKWSSHCVDDTISVAFTSMKLHSVHGLARGARYRNEQQFFGSLFKRTACFPMPSQMVVG